MRKRIDENPTFSIVFKKGKANQNRLPLGHVLSTLREIEAMIRSGKIEDGKTLIGFMAWRQLR